MHGLGLCAHKGLGALHKAYSGAGVLLRLLEKLGTTALLPIPHLAGSGCEGPPSHACLRACHGDMHRASGGTALHLL